MSADRGARPRRFSAASKASGSSRIQRMSNMTARDSVRDRANPATYKARPAALSTSDSPASPKICPRNPGLSLTIDRKSVVSGKSVSGRVDLGGSRSIKKQNTTQAPQYDDSSTKKKMQN